MLSPWSWVSNFVVSLTLDSSRATVWVPDAAYAGVEVSVEAVVLVVVPEGGIEASVEVALVEVALVGVALVEVASVVVLSEEAEGVVGVGELGSSCLLLSDCGAVALDLVFFFFFLVAVLLGVVFG